MRKNLLLTMLIVLSLIASPALASVQNIKVSGSINSGLLYRENYDLGASTTNDEKQNVFYTITKLNVDADLSDNVSASIQFLNERPWGDNLENASTNSGYSDVTLQLAYITLREMLYSPLTVVIGRQSFNYGNSFVVDSGAMGGADSPLASIANDLSEQFSADAVRAILDYSPLKLEFLYSKIDENTATLITDPSGNDDVDLYGVNASYELNDDMKTAVEAYFFAKIDKSVGKASGVGLKNDTIYTPGARISTNPFDGLNLQAEIAMQSGRKVGSLGETPAHQMQKREAMAAQILANYALPENILPGKTKELKPVLGYEFTFASGDETSTSPNVDEDYTGWDPMFENQAAPKIYNALFKQTNTFVNTVSLTAYPIEDLMTKLSISKLTLHKEVNAELDGGSAAFPIYQPDNSSQNVLANWDKKDLGMEIDLEAAYAYTEDVSFGVNFGWFEPGQVFDKTKNGDAAKQALFNVKVGF